MNFSLHIDDETLERLAQAVERTGLTRNRLIGQAIREWLQRHESLDWPEPLREHFRNPAPELAAGVVDFQPWKPGEDR